MRLFIAGDTHGNTRFLCDYLYPLATELEADAIVQLGDFGAWEHTDQGVAFMNDVSWCAMKTGIPLYWLAGNHDKTSLVLDWYGHNRTSDGFIVCRSNVYYIPQGHIWEWEGARFRSFGGAYSIDKPWRLSMERARWNAVTTREAERRQRGLKPESIPDQSQTLWFPEEEMTDDEFERLMAEDSSKMDVIFSHDKPRGANLGPHINLKDLPECIPNQDRLQRALVTHQPDWWFHGHLHHRYETMVRCGDDDRVTRVSGLGPDSDAAPRFWRPTHAWCLLDIDTGPVIHLTSGGHAVDQLERDEENDDDGANDDGSAGS